MSSIQWSAVLYFVGWILLGFSIVLFLVASASLLFSEPYATLFFIAFIIVLLSGLLVIKFIERPVDIGVLDSLIVAILSFFIPGVLHTIVMVLCGFDFWDSLFESVSGITTTGLSVYDVASLPRTILFSRALLQWIGGVGIVILTLGMLLRPGTMAYKLLATHIRKEAVMPSIMIVARAVIVIYSGLTIAAIISYRIAGMDWFESIVHGLTTISTGGFSTRSYLTGSTVIVALVFMFISAQSFPRYYMAFLKRKPKYIGMGPQIKYFVVINVVAIVLSYIAVNTSSVNVGLGDIVFTIISASTTTGYASVSIDELPIVVKYIVIILMVIGASLGSTGGGFKQYRLILLLKEVWRRVLKTVSPQGRILTVRLEGETVADDEIYMAILIINLYLIALVISTIVFLYAGYSFIDSLFTVASALGTVGLAPSIVNKSMQWWIKLLLSIDMFLGRLEILPVVAVVAHGIEGVKKSLRSISL